MKLYYKFFIFILLLLGASTWAGVFFPGKAVRDALSAQIFDIASTDAAEIMGEFRKALASGKEADGIKVLYAFKQRSGAVYAGLLGADHRILAHTNVALAGSRADLDWAADIRAGGPVYRRVSYKGEEIVEALIPAREVLKSSSVDILLDGGEEKKESAGFIWAGLSLAAARKAEHEIAANLVWTNVLGSLFALVVSGFFVRLVLRQVELLDEGIRKAREGDLDWEVKVESRDEIGKLAVFFNEMLRDLKNSKEMIEEYQENLEKKVEERTTELERSQERLLQAGKMAAIGQLVSGVAHELNNPLAGIMGYAQVMLKDGGLTAQQREDLDVIVTQSGRAKEIIRNLLQFSRKKERVQESVPVPDLIDGVLKFVNYEFSTSGIKVELDIQRSLPPVFGDPSQLQQVFLNIITNARDAMAPGGGGRLRITAVTAGGNMVLKFTDTGPGISEENFGRIFDPFFTTKPTGKGTGLGLSISYEIIKNHKGSLSAENGPEGGATFTIELPVTNEKE